MAGGDFQWWILWRHSGTAFVWGSMLCLPLGAAHEVSLLDKLRGRFYEWGVNSFLSSKGGWHTVPHSTLVHILRISRLIWSNEVGKGRYTRSLPYNCLLFHGWTCMFQGLNTLAGLQVFFLIEFSSQGYCCLSIRYVAIIWSYFFSCKPSFPSCCLYLMTPMMNITMGLGWL